MQRLADKARIEGNLYRFERVVEHATSDIKVVLCHNDADELKFVSLDEWLHAGFSQASVTHESSEDDKVSLVMSLFRGRTDIYAKGFVGANTKPGKLSYWPPCRLRWVQGACPKQANSRASCSACDHPSYIPLTREVVRAHCRGQRDKKGRIQAIGIYAVDGDVCHLLAADFDGPGWQEAAAAYRDACRRHGLSPATERSRSGNGAHVWVFFDGSVKASLARRVGEGLVSEARNACTAVSFHSYDRLFPLQDSVGPGSLGSLIALPLQGEAVRQGNSVFVDDGFVTYPDQCAFLSTVVKANPAAIAALAEEFGQDPIGLPEPASRTLTIDKAVDNDATAGEEPLVREAHPGAIQVTLSDGVRIRRDSLPAPVANRLRRLAAFRNPEYGKRLNMHLSVWDIPRFVDLSRLEGDELVLPRGCAKAALETLRQAGIEPFVADGRTEGRHIHAQFVGKLRPTQEPCREKLVKHDLGVLVAPTGFGKSVIAASIIATHQTNTLVIVPNTSLLDQWVESLTRFLSIEDEPPVLLTPTGRKRKRQPGTVGIVGGGQHLRSGIVDVALAGSLFEKGEVEGDSVVSPFVSEYGMVIVDEAQHVAASKVLEVLRTARAHYVYAMTATPKRDDGLDRILFLECGPLRYEVAVADQIAEQGMRRLFVPRFSTVRADFETTTTWHGFMDCIVEDEGRNRLVASDAMRALRSGRTPLVLTRRVEHARVLAGLIETNGLALGVQVVLLVGSDADAIRRERLENLRLVSPDAPLCVVATGSYVGEGFDCDRLDCLLLAGPVAFEGTLAQWVGRLHRVRPDKADVIVMDYVDPAIPMFDNEWHKRLRAYKKLGYEMVEGEDLAMVGLDGGTTPVGHLFAGKEFQQALERDLAESCRSVAIASSWMRLDRVKTLRTMLEGLVDRGVSVRIVLKASAKPTDEWQQTLAMLRDFGCDVHVVAKGHVSLDCVVIDDALVWYGGIAPLAFPRKDDCSIRLVSREVAAALVRASGPEDER